jgi:hypothetical protein
MISNISVHCVPVPVPYACKSIGLLFFYTSHSRWRGGGGGREHLDTSHEVYFKKRGQAKIYLGLRMAYSGRQLLSGKPAKDDGVDSAKAHRGQHGHYGLGHHGHVDEHPVPLHHAQSGQQASHLGHLIFQLPVGQLVLPEMNHTGFANTVLFPEVGTWYFSKDQ